MKHRAETGWVVFIIFCLLMWAGPGLHIGDRPDVWVIGIPLIYFWFLIWSLITIAGMVVGMWKFWFWKED